MKTENVIKVCEFGDGFNAIVSDATSHYFGGYFHVRLQVTADVPLDESWFENKSVHEDAVQRLGKAANFRRVLEKMAVPADEVPIVRNNLLDSFNLTVLPYLSRADFPRRFVLSEYMKRTAKTGASPSFARK